ncbi:mitochondrial ornithine transporter 1-like [Pecten maximus]|uniref:mitochondrial ornithine transporter 1-like n=1 Tax=Pecten maximus TaxID=6579 RepID=UPI0014583A7D|nr:mitochondrial ornithine transporter 1-like [Pecten maximus]
MTHNEERAHWVKEGAIGLGVGVLYGLTNTCVGHPFDTIKTKMQGQVGYEKTNMFQTLTKTLRTQGVIGLYRGCIPPLWGSGIYRSTQFAVFEAMYTYFDNPVGRHEIPGLAGLQLRVVGAGVIASTSRAIIETPLEYAKVRRQTQQTWQLRKVYTGFGVTWARTIGLMTTYFMLVDSIRRHFPDLFKQPILGPFLTSGLAATAAWWIVWPLEYMKCQVQADYGNKMSVLQRMKLIIRERGGFFALYRGIMPGTIRSFLANGTSMIVMSYAQKKVSEMGLRDS